MSGSENTSRTGRMTALAALAASAALFVAALSGIAAIDPSADASASQPAPALRSISLDEQGDRGAERHDCPFKRHDGSRGRDAARSGLES